jgi:hypothetical protein
MYRFWNGYMLLLGRCTEGCGVLTQRYKAKWLKGGMMAAGHPEVATIFLLFSKGHSFIPLAH